MLTAWHRTGSWTGLSVTLRSLVPLLIDTGQAREAAVFHGAVTRPAKGPAPYGADAERLDLAKARLLTALGATGFATLSERGRDLSEGELTEQALRAIRDALDRGR